MAITKMGFIKAVREQLAARNLSARAAAANANLPERSVQGVLEGHLPSIERASEICEALGLEFSVGPPRAPATLQESRLDRFDPGVNLPVRGWARCSIFGHLEDERKFPERLMPVGVRERDADSFYAVALGVSMAPEGIGPGDFCLVSPNTPLQVGSRVWLKDRQGRATIKRLLADDGTSYSVRGWLPPEGRGRQKSYDDQWVKTNVAAHGTVLAVYRGWPSVESPPDLVPDPKPPASVGSMGSDTLSEMEIHTQGLVRAVSNAGGDPIPADLRQALLEPSAFAELSGAPPEEPPGSARSYITMPYARDVRMAAGAAAPAFEESGEFRVLVARGAVAGWAHQDSLICIRVLGASMEPGIRDGDLVVLDRSATEPIDNRTFAVQTHDGPVVKRLRLVDGEWRLTSDNPAYPSVAVGAEDRIIGRVAWSGPHAGATSAAD